MPPNPPPSPENSPPDDGGNSGTDSNLNPRDQARDALVNQLLNELLGRESPPDIAAAVRARAEALPPQRSWPWQHRPTRATVTALAAILTLALTAGLYLLFRSSAPQLALTASDTVHLERNRAITDERAGTLKIGSALTLMLAPHTQLTVNPAAGGPRVALATGSVECVAAAGQTVQVSSRQIQATNKGAADFRISIIAPSPAPDAGSWPELTQLAAKTGTLTAIVLANNSVRELLAGHFLEFNDNRPLDFALGDPVTPVPTARTLIVGRTVNFPNASYLVARDGHVYELPHRGKGVPYNPDFATAVVVRYIAKDGAFERAGEVLEYPLG
jgi:hypothetical protein